MRRIQDIFKDGMERAGRMLDFRELREWLDYELQPYLNRIGEANTHRAPVWT